MTNDMVLKVISDVKKCRKHLKHTRTSRFTNEIRTFWKCSAPGCKELIAFDKGYGTVCPNCTAFENEFEPNVLQPIAESIKKLHDVWEYMKSRKWLPFQKELMIKKEFNLIVKEMREMHNTIPYLSDEELMLDSDGNDKTNDDNEQMEDEEEYREESSGMSDGPNSYIPPNISADTS